MCVDWMILVPVVLIVVAAAATVGVGVVSQIGRLMLCSAKSAPTRSSSGETRSPTVRSISLRARKDVTAVHAVMVTQPSACTASWYHSPSWSAEKEGHRTRLREHTPPAGTTLRPGAQREGDIAHGYENTHRQLVPLSVLERREGGTSHTATRTHTASWYHSPSWSAERGGHRTRLREHTPPAGTTLRPGAQREGDIAHGYENTHRQLVPLFVLERRERGTSHTATRTHTASWYHSPSWSAEREGHRTRPREHTPPAGTTLRPGAQREGDIAHGYENTHRQLVPLSVLERREGGTSHTATRTHTASWYHSPSWSAEKEGHRTRLREHTPPAGTTLRPGAQRERHVVRDP